MESKTLFRSRTDKIIAGVCGGLGRYFDVDPVLVRIIFVVLAVVKGIGILLYILLAIAIPREPLAAAEKGPLPSNGNQASDDPVSPHPNPEHPEAASAPAVVARPGWFDRRRNIVGVLVILIGVIALLDAVLPNIVDWNLLWPLILVAIGLYLVVDHGTR